MQEDNKLHIMHLDPNQPAHFDRYIRAVVDSATNDLLSVLSA